MSTYSAKKNNRLEFLDFIKIILPTNYNIVNIQKIHSEQQKKIKLENEAKRKEGVVTRI